MKVLAINHDQAVLLRRKNKQRFLPKRLHIAESDLDWQAFVLGEIPITYPHRDTDNVCAKFDTEEAEQKFLSEIGITQTSERISQRK